MDDTTTKLLAEMGVNLTTLAVKGTASIVQNKIKMIKTEKEIEKVRNSYEEIISELLTEREEAIRIAKVYKEELEKVEISEADINHLHGTISRVFTMFNSLSSTNPFSEEMFDCLKELISVDTLKTMQLLGFNYKVAIGEPLTQLCSTYILSLSQK